MNRKILIYFGMLIFVFQCALTQENKKLNEFGEISLGYSLIKENSKPNNCMNLALGMNFLVNQNSSFSGLLEINSLFGNYNSKSIFGLGICPGIRFKLDRDKFFIKFDLLSGISSFSLKDSSDMMLGNLSTAKMGIGYDNITLEGYVSTFVGKSMSFNKILGIGLRYQF